jgi:peptidoglycan/LPS O-acetylase OafA/YrhL
MQTVGYTSLAIAFGGLLLIVLGFKPANDAFSNPLMRWFGRYSYGLYVWHPIVNVILFYTPLKAALDIEGPVDSTIYLLFAFATALGVAFASYHLLEQPFLRLKKQFP